MLENDIEDYDEPEIKQPSVPCIDVDFGSCVVYGEYIKNVQIKNLYNTETSCYKIIRDSNITASIYRVFSLEKYEGVINPKQNLKLKVKYNPIIPHRRDIENFDFVDSSYNIIKIRVKGYSAGPVIRASTKHLSFLITPSHKCFKRVLELKNVSNLPAEFVFDLDNENSVFRVEPLKGTLKPQTHIYVHVRFVPKEHGVYAQQLHCISWGGVPEVTELRGVYIKANNYHINTFETLFQSYGSLVKTGYIAYMQDCFKNTNQPVSLSRNYIDFGATMMSQQNSKIEFVTLTNNLENEIIVKWPSDDVFKIIPKKLNIPGKNRASCRCYFYPNANDVFFCKTLTAQIQWSPLTEQGIMVPLTAPLKVQGHSFSEEQYWTANIKISPSTVTLPPCVPKFRTFTNFKIRVLGHLPVMYKLIPPKETDFSMKPMVGVIDSYEIICVDFFWGGSEETKLFNEVWYVELNGRSDALIPLSVRAEVALPQMVIGEKNVLRFQSNQPGYRSTLVVPMKNTSGYQLKFQFRNENYPCIEINPKEGILPSNEELYIEYTYTGDITYPKKLYLKVYLQRVQGMEELVGESYSHKFTVYTDCQYYRLCSTPSCHNFGKVPLNAILETEFYVFNFGLCHADFKINFENDPFNNFKIVKNIGTIGPKEKKKVHVKGLATEVGEYTTIVYYTNKNVNLTDVEQEENIKLFEMSYTVVMPIVQIEDIIDYNYGMLFSKVDFWKHLQIEQINDCLQNMNKGETKSFLLHLPEVPTDTEGRVYHVTLLMHNKTEYEQDLFLKRKKVCDCLYTDVPLNINKTKKKYDCPHREMLSLELSDSKFCGNARQLLEIKVKYLIPEETRLCYILQLPHNRSIEMLFVIYSIPMDTAKLSSYESDFNMRLIDVSICRRVPPIQICWFYNNTNQFADYEVDTTNIESLCQYEGFEVLTCINPKGTVEPYSALPLMLRFQPIEIKEYTIEVPLTCGDTLYEFFITGNGVRNINRESNVFQMPTTTKRNPLFPVSLSWDYIHIGFVPTWSVTERIIFVQNISKNKIVRYIWEEVGITNVIEVTARSKTGTLQPLETQAVVIKMKTFNEPCVSCVYLPCHFVEQLQETAEQKGAEKPTVIEIKDDLLDENPVTKTIVIDFQIIHSNDRDNFFTVAEQFRSSPQDEISINVSNLLNLDNANKATNESLVMPVQDKIKISTILEQLIGDFVFSNSFLEILEYSKKLPSPVYEQFTVDERKIMQKKTTTDSLSNQDLLKFRKNKIRNIFTRPKPTLVSQVMKDLIVNGMHDTFRIGAFIPFQAGDTEELKDIPDKCPSDCKCKEKL